MEELSGLNDVVIVDTELAAKLERTEGLASRRFVEARARQSAGSAATWIQVAGAYAMFDSPDSPITQSFGLGMCGPVTGKDFETIESFFLDRNAPVLFEVSPLASAETLALLNDRRYRPIEYTSVMCRRIGPSVSSLAIPHQRISVRTIAPDESELWAQTSAAGWSEQPELKEMMLDFGRNFTATVGATAMIVELAGQPIATGLVIVADRVALLAGASTVPFARKQGAQSALLAARLQHAVQQKCDLAMLCASPGSPSQRNAQRNGFQIAYTRTKWQLDFRNSNEIPLLATKTETRN